jgi:hypothetical protein
MPMAMSAATTASTTISLNDTVIALWDSAYAPSTLCSYSSAFRQFERFARLYNPAYQASEIREELVLLFIAHCYRNLNLKYCTIKLYLSAIRYHAGRARLLTPGASPFPEFSRQVEVIMRAVKKSTASPTRIRLPITFPILAKIFDLLQHGYFTPFWDLLLQTASVLAFYGFLRASELTVTTSHFDDQINLCLGDIQFIQDNIFTLHLKSSKTDPFKHGVKIYYFPIEHRVCAVKTISRFLSVRRTLFNSSTSPLLLTPEGTALSKNSFVIKIRQLLQHLHLPAHLYYGHSFRRGAATTAHACGISQELIMTLGRWLSESSCKLYIDIPLTEIKHAQQKLANLV